VSWAWLNLDAPEFAEPSEPPTIGGLIYPGLRHVVSGQPESLKTLVALILSLTAQRQDELVAHIDLEMGSKRTRTLLEDLGATANEIHDHIYTEGGGPPDRHDLGHLIGNEVALVTIDAAAGAYNATGLDDSTRQDVEKFAAAWIDPLYQHGVATLLIDHVVKNADQRGKWAIGSERKAGQADVHLGLELIGNPLTRGGNALVKVRVHKDRPGWLTRPYAAELALTSDPATHRITWEWKAPASEHAKTSQGWRPTLYMERVSLHLEEHGPMSRTSIYKAGLGKREYLVHAVDVLLADGNLREDGSRLVPAIPFRHDEAGSRVPKPFPTVPGSPLPLGSHGSPLYRGEPGNGEVADAELERLEALGEHLGLA
jgi:hypothetical protein